MTQTINVFPTVLEAEKFKIKVPADLMSGELRFLVHRPSSHCDLIQQESKKTL